VVTGALEARKRELRRQASAAPVVDASGERSAAIAARVRVLPAYEDARCVALYAALPGEVETAELLHELWQLKRSVVLPRIEGAQLRLRAVVSSDELEAGAWGVREPQAHCPAVDEQGVDLFLVPGLYFDRAGQRLGRGRGCYDRLLERARRDAVCVGLCFADRVIDQVPVAPWDQPLDYVITELETIRGQRADQAKPC
jgi:5-formyltetrahydrofolate cyclo-ligase